MPFTPKTTVTVNKRKRRPFSVVLFRYWRLWKELRASRKEIERLRSDHRQALSKAERENLRLQELSQSLQTKVETVQTQSVDRLFEMQRLIGIGHHLREVDDKIHALRFQPFEDAKRADQTNESVRIPGSLRATLPEDQRTAYDMEYQAHVNRGLADGHDRATIERVWKQYEPAITQSLGDTEY